MRELPQPTKSIAGFPGFAAVPAAFMAERRRWLLWLPPFFASGIGFYFLLPWEPWPASGALLLLLLLGVIWAVRGKLLALALASLIAMVAAGFTTAQLRSLWVAAPVLERESRGITLVGDILEISLKSKGARLILGDLEYPESWEAARPEKVRVTVAGGVGAKILPGDRISLRAVLRPPPEPVAPGSYDFARRAWFEGLGAVGYAISKPKRLESADVRSGSLGVWARWLLFWEQRRLAFTARIRAVLPGEPGAVAVALTTGLKGGLAEATRQAMRDAGLAHLLAISGLHMGLVAGWVFFAVRLVLALIGPLALRYPIKKWAAVAAVVVAFCYLFLAGTTVPTQRAFIMVGTVFLAVLLDRRAISLRLVAWAAFLVLLIAPESLLSASFQLSFAAVTALIATYEYLSGQQAAADEPIFWSRNRNPAIRLLWYFAGVALTSVVAVLATAPLVAYDFNRLALYGLAANMIAVPLTAFWIMPWAILAFCLMPFGGEFLALLPMGWGIEIVLTVAKAVAAWPHAVVVIAAAPLEALLMVVLGGLWLCLWQRPWRLFGLVAVAPGLLFFAVARTPDILIRDDGALAAIIEGDVFAISERRIGKFERENWQRLVGLSEAEFWPPNGALLEGRLTCDIEGCLYRRGGQVIAFVSDGRALAEDCWIASLLISREPLRRHPCPIPERVIDRFDLWREGAHAVYLNPEGPTVVTVRQSRGARPWVLQRGRQ